MPYNFEINKTPLPRDKDRRVKLSDEDRVIIRDNVEGKSQRYWAAKYGVSRRLIQFIQDPEKQRQNLLRREERGGWKQYYDKENNTESMREHRKYKNKILSETM